MDARDPKIDNISFHFIIRPLAELHALGRSYGDERPGASITRFSLSLLSVSLSLCLHIFICELAVLIPILAVLGSVLLDTRRVPVCRRCVCSTRSRSAPHERFSLVIVLWTFALIRGFIQLFILPQRLFRRKVSILWDCGSCMYNCSPWQERNQQASTTTKVRGILENPVTLVRLDEKQTFVRLRRLKTVQFSRTVWRCFVLTKDKLALL